jgi:protein-tyrosine kinase
MASTVMLLDNERENMSNIEEQVMLMDDYKQTTASEADAQDDMTLKTLPPLKRELSPMVETPLPSPAVIHKKNGATKSLEPFKTSKRDMANARMLQERCRHLCLSLFFREQAPIRSLGITSSIQEEGKSFIALITAQVLSRDSSVPVTLVECNWEHPTLHDYFKIPSTPGLAEWLLGSCDKEDIRYQVDDNLTVIPAGNGLQSPVKLLKKIQQRGLLNTLAHSNELFIVDLPPIITTGYGVLAASLLESVVLVVRTEAVPASMVEEVCSQLKDVPVHGIILNQGVSRIPRWIRQLL